MQPRVVAVPCLSDNYAYLIHAPGSRDAIVVDASEGAPVIAALEREGLRPVAVLSTHHHPDHVGGNEAMAARFPGIEIVASKYDEARVPGRTLSVDDGAEVELGPLGVRAMMVPGHTLGAVAYVIGDAVFTGDTLFIAGCGRLFEGTAADMYDSLALRLGALPPETRVYCGHEYTVSNARFALAVDGDNAAVRSLLERATAQRERGEPTVPSTIGDELAFNPFMRVREPALVHAAGDLGDPVAVLGAIRKQKDTFKA
ncbi:MAG TPA: hydroxyacylglutathione hydrolase [Polyangiaceae bacterium]|jgi:hydroxyacylglutathione hydrolase|nr:hydroxyacylglutathione hydrolase [Polyangiaceae bacterium]